MVDAANIYGSCRNVGAWKAAQRPCLAGSQSWYDALVMVIQPITESSQNKRQDQG